MNSLRIWLCSTLIVSLNLHIANCDISNEGDSSSDTSGESDQQLNDVIVRTSNGRVQGERLKTLFDDKTYYSFKGIPYAEPPVGDLRFKVKLEKICYLWNVFSFFLKLVCLFFSK